jgi:mRNA interferase ChpB
MIRSNIPKRGDVFWIDPNPVAGREMKDRHRFVVITPKEINILGVSMTVPITSGGVFTRDVGLAAALIYRREFRRRRLVSSKHSTR